MLILFLVGCAVTAVAGALLVVRGIAVVALTMFLAGVAATYVAGIVMVGVGAAESWLSAAVTALLSAGLVAAAGRRAT